MRESPGALGMLLIFAGCVEVDLGEAPFLCRSGIPQCPAGYRCAPREGRDICLRDGTPASGDAAAHHPEADSGRALSDGAAPPLPLPPTRDATLADHPQVGGGLIEGDWFTCKYSSLCSLLDNDGLQFRAGGLAVALVAPGEFLEAGESYCEAAADAGSYSWDGALLEVQMKVGTLRGKVSLQAGLFTVEWMSLPGGGNLLKQPIYMKRVSPRSTGACK